MREGYAAALTLPTSRSHSDITLQCPNMWAIAEQLKESCFAVIPLSGSMIYV